MVSSIDKIHQFYPWKCKYCTLILMVASAMTRDAEIRNRQTGGYCQAYKGNEINPFNKLYSIIILVS